MHLLVREIPQNNHRFVLFDPPHMSLEPQVLTGWFQIFTSKKLVSPTIILNCLFGLPGVIFLNDFHIFSWPKRVMYRKRRNGNARAEFRKVRRSRNARKDFKVLTTRIIAAFSVPINGPRTTKSTWKWVPNGSIQPVSIHRPLRFNRR